MAPARYRTDIDRGGWQPRLPDADLFAGSQDPAYSSKDPAYGENPVLTKSRIPIPEFLPSTANRLPSTGKRGRNSARSYL